MGKKHKLRARNRSNPPVSSSPHPGKSSLKLLMLSAVVGCLIGGLVTFGAVQAINFHAAPVPAAGTRSIPTLAELVMMTPEQLAKQDIAAMNLRCAEGLPGAEKLDIGKYLDQLDRWAAQVREVTQRHLYRVNDSRYADHYQHSEAVLRAEFLCQVLQEDLGVHYDMHRVTNINFTNSKDLFIHGMIGDSNGGTCASMPILYAAVGRRLGYPIKLSTTREHVFNRWEGMDSANPTWRQRFNFESTGPGFSTFSDDYYKKWPKAVSDFEVKNCGYLRTLTPAEELAEFFADRGHCLLDNGHLHEAQLAYGFAHQLAPDSRLMFAFFSDSVGKEIARLNPTVNTVAMQPPPANIDSEVTRIEAINAANRMRLGVQWQEAMPRGGVSPYAPNGIYTGQYPPNQ